MEEKDPVSHDHGSASSGDVMKVTDFCNRGEEDIKYLNLCLKEAKEVGNKHGEGVAYGNLGNAYHIRGDFEKAIKCHNLDLKIAKEIENKLEQGRSYCNLGDAYYGQCDFIKAIEYYNLYLEIAKGERDKRQKGYAYGHLGRAHFSLSEFKKARDYFDQQLKVTKKEKDRLGKGTAYGNLGIAHTALGDFKKAIKCHKLHLKIARKEKDKRGKGNAYGNLGNAHHGLGDFQKAIEYHNLNLKIARKEKDKHGEGGAYTNLGIAYHDLSDFNKAIEFHELGLKIAKKVGNKRREGQSYGNLGNSYYSLGDFNKAIEYHVQHLEIARGARDKQGEGAAYGNLGNAYFQLGYLKKAIKYHNLHLKIAKEVGDKYGEGNTYTNLGNAYRHLGDSEKAIEFHNLHLKIAKKVGDKHGEGNAYGNLGNAHHGLGDFKKAIEYHKLHLKIAKEVKDKHGKGGTFGNLGNAYHALGDFKKAFKYHKRDLKIAKKIRDKQGKAGAYYNLGNAYRCLGDLINANKLCSLSLTIAKEVEDRSLEALAYHSLGLVFESQGELPKAVTHYQFSVSLYNSLRVLLKSKDKWKVDFRNKNKNAYSGLFRVLVKQGNIDQALFAAEKGRAQALTDLMDFSFCGGTSQHKTGDEDLADLKNVPSNTVFQVVDEADVSLLVVSEGKQVQLRQSKLTDSVSEKSEARQSFQSFIVGVYTQLGVPFNVRCEDRSLDALWEGRPKVGVRTKEDNPQPHIQQDESGLSTLYDILMKPAADLVQGDELVIIPDGPLWLAPYAALKDGRSKYLCESFRIRLAPSLTSLRLIADCPDDYHKSSGALLVGDPWVSEVTNSEGEKVLEQLPCAKEEVEMIGKILNITPITGRQATKREVLKRLSSVSLVHLAAHGCPETGQIALAPDPDRISPVLKEEDYILTIEDVLKVKLRAKLVVLSCCHSGRGEIKAEGVVGIARAFMGAGARSVVVSLWAISDKATLAFMKCFYQHLAEGKPASESLNLAMKSLRESDKFHDIKYWAPFSLIGDDVTLDLKTIAQFAEPHKHKTRKRKRKSPSTCIPKKVHKSSSNQAE